VCFGESGGLIKQLFRVGLGVFAVESGAIGQHIRFHAEGVEGGIGRHAGDFRADAFGEGQSLLQRERAEFGAVGGDQDVFIHGVVPQEHRRCGNLAEAWRSSP